MNYANKLEMKRLFRIMDYNGLSYAYPLLDDYMRGQAIDQPRMFRLWTWDDSSRIVAFLD